MWNFTKFLVNAEGQAVARFGPGETPLTMVPNIKELTAMAAAAEAGKN